MEHQVTSQQKTPLSVQPSTQQLFAKNIASFEETKNATNDAEHNQGLFSAITGSKESLSKLSHRDGINTTDLNDGDREKKIKESNKLTRQITASQLISQQITELKEDLSNLQEARYGFEAELAQVNHDIKSLDQSIATTQNDITKTEDQFEQKQKETEALENGTKQIEEKLQNAIDTKSQKTDELAATDKHFDKNLLDTNEKSPAADQIDLLETLETRERQEIAIQEAEVAVNIAQDELDHRMEALHKSKLTEEGLKNRIVGLKSKMEEMKAERLGLQGRKEGLETKIEDSLKQEEVLKGKIEFLENVKNDPEFQQLSKNGGTVDDYFNTLTPEEQQAAHELMSDFTKSNEWSNFAEKNNYVSLEQQNQATMIAKTNTASPTAASADGQGVETPVAARNSFKIAANAQTPEASQSSTPAPVAPLMKQAAQQFGLT